MHAALLDQAILEAHIRPEVSRVYRLLVQYRLIGIRRIDRAHRVLATAAIERIQWYDTVLCGCRDSYRADGALRIPLLLHEIGVNHVIIISFCRGLNFNRLTL